MPSALIKNTQLCLEKQHSLFVYYKQLASINRIKIILHTNSLEKTIDFTDYAFITNINELLQEFLIETSGTL